MRGMPIARQVVEGPSKREYSTLDRHLAAMQKAELDEYTTTQGLDFGREELSDYAFGRDDILDKLEAGDKIGKLSAKELNERFPHVEKAFTEPTSYLVADHLNNEAKKKKEYQQIISNDGEASAFSTTAYSLVGGLAAGATDPVNLAIDAGVSIAALASGGVLGVAAGVASKAGQSAKVVKNLNRASKVLKGSGLSTKGQFAKESAEGIVGNLALEPTAIASAERAQVDYTIFDSAVTIIGGGVGLPAIKFAGVKGAAGLGNMGRYVQNHDMAPMRALKAMKDNLDAGKNYVKNLEFLGAERQRRIEGVVRDNLDPTSVRGAYEILRHPDVKKVPFYSGGKSPGSFDSKNNHVVGDSFGNGVHLTDNPNIANNVTQMPDNISTGQVHEIDIESANVIDIDELTASPTGQMLKQQVPEEYRAIFDEARTLKDALTSVKERLAADRGISEDAAADLINADMAKVGIDGYSYHEKKTGNYAFLFNDEKINNKQSFDSDPSTLPPPNKAAEAELRTHLTDESSNIFHSKKSATQKLEAEQYSKQKQKTRDNLEENQAKQYEDFEATYDKHKDTGALPEHYKEAAEAIKLQRHADDLEDEYFEFISDCISKGGDV